MVSDAGMSERFAGDAGLTRLRRVSGLSIFCGWVCAVDESTIFHPSDEDLSPGTPGPTAPRGPWLKPRPLGDWFQGPETGCGKRADCRIEVSRAFLRG